ncbi:MAG: DeoR/GlpR family DNA-binding transcription regulator [Treponema sp.]
MSNRKNQRVFEVLKLLKSDPDKSIAELADSLSVSEMTIRRDLRELEKKNIYQKKNIITVDSLENVLIPKESYSLESEISKNLAEKEKIGKYAVSLIEPNDILIIDAGTTTGTMSKYLPSDIPYTVICNNFYILDNIYRMSNISIIVPGGYYHSADQLFESTEGISLIKKHRATKLFLSAAGVHEKLGLTCGHAYETLAKQAMIESSLYKILLVDSSKFNRITPNFFSRLDEMDLIITDSMISADNKKKFEDLGLNLKIV